MLSSGATTRDVPALSAPIIAHLSHCGYHRGLSSHGFVLAYPENLLLEIDALHVLAVCAAGYRQSCRMTVVCPDYLSRVIEFNCQNIFRRKLEVNRRVVDIAQGMRQLDMPVLAFIYASRK